MLSNLSESVDKLDKKFKGEQSDTEETTTVKEEKQTHILFDFIPEDICLNILKHLEKNYQGSNIVELSKLFNLDRETMGDYIEILLNYGLVIETLVQKERIYVLHEGSYYRFVQEIKK